jgi:hypothetical protein
MDFHEKHYSANKMKLVILGREPLDRLEGWAADLFAGVRNKSLSQNRWESEVPFGASDLLTQCFAKPVMDSRELDLSFPFIDEELLFESQPSRYISHLIGHEGPGSIMSYIKAKGWANGLSAGMFTGLLSVRPEISSSQAVFPLMNTMLVMGISWKLAPLILTLSERIRRDRAAFFMQACRPTPHQ